MSEKDFSRLMKFEIPIKNSAKETNREESIEMVFKLEEPIIDHRKPSIIPTIGFNE